MREYGKVKTPVVSLGIIKRGYFLLSLFSPYFSISLFLDLEGLPDNTTQ